MSMFRFTSIFSFVNPRGSSNMLYPLSGDTLAPCACSRLSSVNFLIALHVDTNHKYMRPKMSPPESQIFWPEEKRSLSRENDKLRWKGFQTSKSSRCQHFCDSFKNQQARMLSEIKITGVSNSLGQFKRESFFSDQNLRRVRSLWHFEEKARIDLRFIVK